MEKERKEWEKEWEKSGKKECERSDLYIKAPASCNIQCQVQWFSVVSLPFSLSFSSRTCTAKSNSGGCGLGEARGRLGKSARIAPSTSG